MRQEQSGDPSLPGERRRLSVSGKPAAGRRSLRRTVLVFLAAFLTFAGTIGYGYVWDDPHLTARVRHAVSEGDIGGLLASPYYVKTAGSARYYRPVMMASLAGDAVLAPGSPLFSHLLNVLLHALNAVLVLALLRRITEHDTGALAGALLFAVHPVHAAAVAAVYNRAEVLSLALMMPLALRWPGFSASGQKRAPVGGALALGAFFLACLTKETAYLLPAVFFGWQLLGRGGLDSGRLRFLGSACAAAAAAFIVRTAVFAGDGPGAMKAAGAAGTLAPHLLVVNIGRTLAVNMRLALFPLPGRTHWAGADLAVGWTTALMAALFGLMVIVGLRLNARVTARGLIWWAVFTLPVSGIFHLGPVAATQRYAYVPSVGVCLIVAGLTARLMERIPSGAWVKGVAAAVSILLGAGAAVQARQWSNNVALFTRISASNPTFAAAHLNLGVALASGGRNGEALEAYRKAGALAPEWSDVAFNRGNLYLRMGRYEEALRDFDAVLETRPGDWESSLNRGNALLGLGRAAEAAGSYRDAREHGPSSGKPLVALGVLAARAGRYGEAMSLFRDAARREPGLSAAHEGLGEVYLIMGMAGLARASLSRALDLEPGNTGAARKLGELLINEGRPDAAAQAFRSALASDPTLFEAWKGLVRSLDQLGRKTESDDLIRELGDSDPDLARRVALSRERPESTKAAP